MSKIILPDKINCGYFDCAKFGNLKESPKRITKCYEIEYFLEDGLITFLNNKEYKIKADYILIAKPGSERHSMLPFKTMFLKFKADNSIAQILDSQPCIFFAHHKKQIKELLHELIVINENNNKDIFLLNGKLMSLLSFIIKDAEHESRGTNYNYNTMHKAKMFIEKHFCDSINGTDIALTVNLSESRLRYLFNIAYGISPHEYLIETRISAAKEMLWSTDYSIIEISEKCGFGCQQYMTDIFKKRVKISPKKYREQFAKKYID